MFQECEQNFRYREMTSAVMASNGGSRSDEGEDNGHFVPAMVSGDVGLK